MDEEMVGDRTTICQLLYYIGLLGDIDWLTSRWRERDVYSSFEALVTIIFDDHRLIDVAAMRPGYLGMPETLLRDLRGFAQRLNSFSDEPGVQQRASDTDILSLSGFESLSSAARAVWNPTGAWRDSNCDPVPLRPS